jgi:hypothetical protein
MVQPYRVDSWASICNRPVTADQQGSPTDEHPQGTATDVTAVALLKCGEVGVGTRCKSYSGQLFHLHLNQDGADGGRRSEADNSLQVGQILKQRL